MSWEATKQKIKAARDYIQQHDVLDAAFAGALGEIPFVGGFLSNWWAKTAEDGAADAEKLATLLDQLSAQEAVFEEFRRLMQSHEEQLAAGRVSLDTMLVLVGELSGDVKNLGDQVSGMAAEVSEIRAVTKQRFVGDAFKAAATLIDDRKRQAQLIGIVTAALEKRGDKADAESLYQLGAYFTLSNDSELAEACLLQATELDDTLTEAYVLLGTIYQLRAYEFIVQENYGFAEDVLDKAKAYVALADDPTALGIDNQLGYIYKDFAQRFRGRDPQRMAKNLSAAEIQFKKVLGVEPNDPGALNGMGSVLAVKGQLEEAMDYIERAIEVRPRYPAAHCDLAQCCYALVQRGGDPQQRQELLRKGLTSYLWLAELRKDGIALPDAAQQRLDEVYQPLVQRLRAGAG